MKQFSLALLLSGILMSTAIAAPITPEKLLPNGKDSAVFTNPYTGEKGEVRKGTIGSTILNIHQLNTLLKNTTQANDDEISNILKTENELIPSLKILGLFDIFSVEEWLQNAHSQPGRTLIALHYLIQNPSACSDSVMVQVNALKQEKHIHPYLKQVLAQI